MAHVKFAAVLLLTAIALPVYAQSQTPIIRRDADWYAAERLARQNGIQIVEPSGYTDGEDTYVRPVPEPELTGIVAVDNAARFVWNNVGKLILFFTLIFAAIIFRDKLNGGLMNGGLTYSEGLRKQAAERWAEEQGDDIHNPFDSPEGMQPASQYVSVRTRR